MNDLQNYIFLIAAIITASYYSYKLYTERKDKKGKPNLQIIFGRLQNRSDDPNFKWQEIIITNKCSTTLKLQEIKCHQDGKERTLEEYPTFNKNPFNPYQSINNRYTHLELRSGEKRSIHIPRDILLDLATDHISIIDVDEKNRFYIPQKEYLILEDIRLRKLEKKNVSYFNLVTTRYKNTEKNYCRYL